MIDELIPYRIKRIYASSSDKEKYYLRKILEEISETGDSQTYRDIWLEDYIEIPVDIDTFLCDDYYLGKSNREGEAVYPFWKDFMRKLFHAGNKYEEVILTGATRIGKSSTAVTCVAHMLYKLMCLRDPQQYFGKKDISVFSILFFNLTKELAAGVAYREFQDLILSSPWFLDHGQKMGSEKNPYYVPNGGKITIDYGSDAAHSLGKQVFCLVGDTQVLTNEGFKRIDELVDTVPFVGQYHKKEIYFFSAHVQLTKYTDYTVRIETEDGFIIEGTADHQILLADETYTSLGELSTSDLLLSFDFFNDNVYESKIVRILHILHPSDIPVYDVIDAQPFHNFITDGGFICHNCAVMDELNFSRAGVKDVSKAKAHMKDLYTTVADRVKGTFRMEGEVYGKIFAVSSKRGDSDFMEAYVQDQIAAGAGEHMLIADAPQWEVLPKSMFSEGTFYIAVGDRHKKGFVVPDNQTHPEALDDLKNQGYQLLTPPINMKSQFIADFEIALRDLAGIAVVGSLSFITQDVITRCINTRRRCPFYNDMLQIGTQDSYTIQEFFHMSDVPVEYKRMPMFIHLDLSLNTDSSGIGGIVINGRKDIEDESGKVTSFPTFGHVFSVAIKAPRGDRIPYSKIIAFIKWLRDQGFNIEGISRDQYQSEYVGQLLEEQGFKVDKLSLDRTPDGYVALRSVLLEQRIDMLDHQLLQDELIHLQRDANTGRVDHPLGGCFVPETKVKLTDGRSVSMFDLAKEQNTKENFVYTINETTLKVEIKKILSAHQTKIVNELMEVVLENDQSIFCTNDHKFMISDGSYRPAHDLVDGLSLMSIEGQERSEVKVKSLMRVADTRLMYDLTIEDNPNFLLDSGVVVHNSKDVADGFAGAIWNAILTNPEIPVPVKSVAKAFQAVNSRSPYNPNKMPSMFGNYRKL